MRHVSRRVPVQAWASIGACSLLWIAFGSQIVGGARKHDFLNLYTGASLALDGNFARLHDPAVQLERERRYVPELPALVPFVRPHFYAAALAPLALIPFAPAFWVWLGLQTLVLLLCWRWAFERWGPDALIFGALFLPTALGIAHGQDCVLMLAILIASYTLAEREEWYWSGAALGLGLIKFHLFLLWPVALILQKRWRMLAGLSAAVAIELSVCLLLAGPRGLQAYAALLQNKDIERLNPSPELMINVHSLALNLKFPSSGARFTLVAIVLLLLILTLRNAPVWKMFCVTSTGTLLVVPHVYGYDAGLLLLPLWLAIYCSTALWPRLAATVLVTPLPFMMTLAGAPWAATAPLAILFFLLSMLVKSPPKHTPQNPVSS